MTDGHTFRVKAKKIFDDIYDYSKVIYLGAHKKVEIICKKHGSFKKSPSNHLSQKQGCPICSKENQGLNSKGFIDKAIEKHGLKYDYTSTIYKHSTIDIVIKCKKHGEFTQKPKDHLYGNGCPYCAGVGMTQELFIAKASTIHDNIYNYDLVKYTSSQNKVDIVCKKHGIYTQRPAMHLRGRGCPKCSRHGFNINKPGILYYFKDLETGLYKIGITNKTVEERFEGLSKRIQIIQILKFDRGQTALDLETELLEEFRDFRTTNNDWPNNHNGQTEFFLKDILELEVINGE